jgi:dTDP-4-amino-4,6-dideoxygalactose transaminase
MASPSSKTTRTGLFGRYKGRLLGTFGTFATQSFHETKNFICGEGGALLINDAQFIERAEIIRDKGTNRARFFRGEVDKYTWVDLGSSYPPSDILAAFLFAQLEAREDISQKRRHLWERYNQSLAGWAQVTACACRAFPRTVNSRITCSMFLMPVAAERSRLIAHLKAKSILAVFHYLPLHASPMGERFGGRLGDCPVTEDISDRLLRCLFITA